jgi:hypothetical protein
MSGFTLSESSDTAMMGAAELTRAAATGKGSDDRSVG